MRVRYSCLALTLAALLLTACSTSAPGVVNKGGTYETLLDGTTTKVTEAAKAAVADLKLKLVTSSATEIDGNVEALTANDTSVTVRVYRETERTSRLTIRVGTLGDQAMSMLLLEKIKARL